MTGTHAHHDHAARDYFHHSSAPRVNTDVVVDPVRDPVYGLGLKHRQYLPPSRRFDAGPGAFVDDVTFAKYLYKWHDNEAIVYVADGRDGTASYPASRNHYILTTNEPKLDELIKQASLWGAQLHNQVWLFDGGYWQKSAELYHSVQKADWANVILDGDMKKALVADVDNFFDGQKTYQDLKVPWKRGVIYYGPPGNGKTITIKAMMHSLYQRGVEKGDHRLTVPTLYVRTLTSFGGPEYSLRAIFAKARQEAPCYLVFEDLDSIVNDRVRSYFLNEVDGLTSNDGIMMVGSTNHLDRLDPGISKRPSRFDRKYYFPNPDFDQRVQYAHFWQTKLKDNKDIDFPDKLCPKVAAITDKFSFAYMQEAFIASLLAIAVRRANPAQVDNQWSGPDDPLAQMHVHAAVRGGGGDDHDPDLDRLELWVELQKQVKNLREEMDDERDSAGTEALPITSRPGRGARSKYRDELDALLHGNREEQQQ
ncbi:hypothetical protein ACEQ8H_007140 [Pleosporales sp. CAS-2024a]